MHRLQLARNYGRVFMRSFSGYPKHEVVGMPALSPTMTVGTIASWKKKAGDQCVPGDTIAEIETDKASIAFEAQDEYYIAKILVGEGSEVACGNAIMVTVEDEASVAAFANFSVSQVESVPAPKKEAPAAPAPVVSAPVAPTPVPAPLPVVTKEVPPPVVAPASPAPTPAPAPSTSSVGFVSVRWGTVGKSAISTKLAADQAAYIKKYGRTGHK